MILCVWHAIRCGYVVENILKPVPRMLTVHSAKDERYLCVSPYVRLRVDLRLVRWRPSGIPVSLKTSRPPRFLCIFWKSNTNKTPPFIFYLYSLTVILHWKLKKTILYLTLNDLWLKKQRLSINVTSNRNI